MLGYPGQTCAPDLLLLLLLLLLFVFFFFFFQLHSLALKKKFLLDFCYHIFSYFKKTIIKPNEIHDSDRGLNKLSHETRVNPIYFSLFYI